jgi:serine/threonine protein kinase/Tfp pilus assembly protein PilF
MIDKTILHYKIIEKLGEGGMGVVYKAHDSKLDRTVAIKFLPRHVAANEEEKKRFVIEAKAAAALNHPNIATIHAIEESENETFIVMEYIDGQELKKKIHEIPPAPPLGKGGTDSPQGVESSTFEGGARRAGDVLPLDNVINYATQIAKGLQAAHNAGIVHRDIKSTNIMITGDDQIKIMDFGLAKVHGVAGVTKEGTTLGTITYMSPEQGRGEEIDQRTDIWAFGVVLYEMLTGQLPFKGDYEQAVIYSIMNEEPQSVADLRDDVSPQIEEIVSKALQKNPQKRYQNANEIIQDFQETSKPSSITSSDSKENISSAGKKSHNLYYALAAITILLIIIVGYLFLGKSGKIDSLAVLPFTNASTDADTEYLSDGITSSLINRLAEFSGLKVMSRLSVARFKDGSEDPLAAGRLMGVKSILAGQMDLRGDKLIVEVDLLKVSDGQQLWGERFERDKKDILTIEHDIVDRISDKLKVKLIGSKQTNHEDDVSLDPTAYDNYLRGRYIMLGTSDDGPARAQEYFRQAIEREPRLAIAHAGLGESYVDQAWLSSRDRDEIVPLAKAALRKAMELDPGLCEAHVLEGDIALYFDWDWAAAEQGYRSAMELNPGSDLAHREYSNFLLLMDYPEKAVAEARIAQSLDPLSVYATHQLGYNLLATGRPAEAVVEFHKAIDLNPTWVWGNIKMGMAYSLIGDKENATKAMLRADELLAGKHPSPLAQDWLAQIAYMCGDSDRIYETIKRLQGQGEQTYVEPVALADMFYRLDNFDKMFECLEQGYEARSPLMSFMLLQGRFVWKRIKDDPRYVSLLKRLNFPNAKL